MNLHIEYMTPTEVQFVKLYATTLKSHYWVFCGALHFMRTDMGVKCPVRASQLAWHIQELHADFEQELAAVATKHSARSRQLPEVPSVDDIVNLIKISFFKLVEPKEHAPPNDAGWFSGHPFEWEKSWQKLQTEAKEPSYSMTAWMKAFLKYVQYPHKKLPPHMSYMHENYEAYDDEDEDGDTEDDNDPDYYEEG